MMQTLQRNQTTAAQAMEIEDSEVHPLRDGRHSAKYFEMLKARRALPVALRRQDFLDAYHQHQVIVLSSEKGSGTTTQIPQFVLFDEYASGMMVACTQPRKVAAAAAAERVASEMDVNLGEEVGYGVRFENVTTDTTRLRYMSDGLLLREAMEDGTFSKYSCVIVDEAHQRTVASDILMALLKQAVLSRNDLKVIIMSAAVDTTKLQEYFGGAPLFKVLGTTFPVEIQYLSGATHNYSECGVHLVKHIHKTMPAGDILFFLLTVDEIGRTCSELRETVRGLEVLPFHATLSATEQGRVFNKSASRRCIVSTNFAETSRAIYGIVYVIDTGLSKRAEYNPRVGAKAIVTETISKVSAGQRVGLAGRTQPGMCFRLYTEDTYNNVFTQRTLPAILSSEITSEILALKVAGYNAVGRFDFIDPPHPDPYLRGLRELAAMGYIDTNGSITSSGQLASRLPVHPVWYNAIVKAHGLNCSAEMVFLAALASSTQSIFVRPYGSRYAADAVRPRFFDGTSDHLSQLNALHAYVRTKVQGIIDMEKWCLDAFLSGRSLEEVISIRQQLIPIACGFLSEGLKSTPFSDESYNTNIRKALAQSFFHQAALYTRKGDDIYVTVHENHQGGIHPESALVGRNYEWVVYDTFIHSGMQYFKTVTAVDPAWLIDLEYFQDDRLSKKRGDKGLRQPKVKTSLDEARAKAGKA